MNWTLMWEEMPTIYNIVVNMISDGVLYDAALVAYYRVRAHKIALYI